MPTYEEKQVAHQISTDVFKQIAKHFVFKPPKIEGAVIVTKGHPGYIVRRFEYENALNDMLADGIIDNMRYLKLIGELNRQNCIIARRDRPVSVEEDELIKNAFSVYLEDIKRYVRKNRDKTFNKRNKEKKAKEKLAEADALLRLFGVISDVKNE
jgi:hypothetical protein